MNKAINEKDMTMLEFLEAYRALTIDPITKQQNVTKYAVTFVIPREDFAIMVAEVWFTPGGKIMKENVLRAYITDIQVRTGMEDMEV